jgi:chaperonin GroES
MKLRPLHDRVIVKRLEQETKTASGIVKTGDRVLFGKYSGQTVKVDGDELLVMREEDLFAVVEK